MRKTVFAIAMAVAAATPAVAQYQMTYFLTGQWLNNMGQRMCQYGNGTVLNVGVNICPLSIKG